MSELAGKGCEIIVPFDERQPLKDIERSIIKKYRKHLWSKFIKAIRDYNLVEEGDKIAVAISGGKDSLLMAKMFQELKRHGQVNFEVEFIAMDPGYHKDIRQLLIDNCEYLDIPIHLFDSKIFEIADEIAKDYPCYMCARMRRGYLYNKAKELGCNKIALGHHFDDVIETTLLSMFYGAEIKTMMPKLHSDNYEGMELIRPLYLIKERDIISWMRNNELEFINCACRFTEKIEFGDNSSKRKEIKELINNLRKINPDIDHNIFKSLDNVNMNCILGNTKDGVYTSFLEKYDE